MNVDAPTNRPSWLSRNKSEENPMKEPKEGPNDHFTTETFKGSNQMRNGPLKFRVPLLVVRRAKNAPVRVGGSALKFIWKNAMRLTQSKKTRKGY